MPHWLHPHLDADQHLRFDRYMERALYDPDHGYYSKHITTVGHRGDFATSATLSPALARGIAARILREQPADIIEIGAGSGELTRSIRKAIPFLKRRRMRFHIVERSPVLRTQQQDLLGRKVHWHDSMADALGVTNGTAFILSNELVDAFPPRVFQTIDNAWQELFLTLDDGKLHESWHHAPKLPDSTVFSHHWPDGQRLEVHHSYQSWLAGWSPAWTGGTMLTIDYGGSPPDIYHRRPSGSLRAYTHHQVLAGPAIYESPGRRDLTADVNFDDLQHWGEALDLHTVDFTTQRDFLLPHARPTDADRFLTDPNGAGTAFKVLRQSPKIV